MTYIEEIGLIEDYWLGNLVTGNSTNPLQQFFQQQETEGDFRRAL